jgi:heme exporter protein B
VTTANLLTGAFSLFVRDLTVSLRRGVEVVTPLIFFVIVISLFPLGVGPEPALLRTMAPGILWVAALLASMLSLNQLFSHDYIDGSLEQLLLAGQPLAFLVLIKTAAHWLITGLPLALIAPVLALQLHLPDTAMPVLILALLLGTPVLSLLGGIAAALTLGVRGGGILVSLLVLPLYTPVLIFGTEAVAASSAGLDPGAHLSLLGACLALALSFAPWAAASALRISLD